MVLIKEILINYKAKIKALLNKNTKTKLINTDIACSSIVDFLKTKNIEITGRQFEMIKDI